MGVVWVARHIGLDVPVALKLVLPGAGSEEAASRLVQEAQVAARLNHPAVLRVLDVGQTEAGDPFLVMELLDGVSLAAVLQREVRLAPVLAVRIILPIAEALSAVHAKGIVHRDVKPQNIFLAHGDSGRWQPKLIDFGAAKVEPRPAEHRISRSGIVIGTPIYMSPEQIQGAEASAGSDVFALSVVLYEAITGAPPFDWGTLASLLVALPAGGLRSLSDHGVHEPELWAILRRGLAPRDARWPEARDLHRALARWLRDRGATADIGGVAVRTGSIPEGDALLAAYLPFHDEPWAPDSAAPSPRAVTLDVKVEPRPPSAPPRAGRRFRRGRLAIGLSAVVVSSAIAATQMLTARPPAAPTEGEPPAASAALPPIAATIPTPAPAPRPSRPRLRATSSDSKGPFR
jgi:serine/threonine-protein kinase